MSTEDATYSAGLLRLIGASEPLWGGEAEVIRTYWDWPARNSQTDRKWLIHQIYKEYWDGIFPPLEQFQRQLPGASDRQGRSSLLAISEVLHEEVEHFTYFADLYGELTNSDYSLSPEDLKVQGAWPENDELMLLRQRHKAESRHLGERAQFFTEGGHCALFTEGMALQGRGGFDDAVADVCRRIYQDEFNHMLLGIIESDDATLSDTDWDTMTRFTTAQLQLRIVMRNAQFSHPLPPGRLEELLRSGGEPVKFDFSGAESLLQKNAGIA